MKKDRGKGEGAPTVPFLQAALSFLPFSLSPLKTPMSESAQVDGQGRNCHRHLGAHQEEKPKGGEESWREGTREGGSRREEERGRREGGTEERRLNKETRSWGWQGVQGRGGQRKGSRGTWGRDRGPGGQIVQSDPDLPSLQCVCICVCGRGEPGEPVSAKGGWLL